MRTTSCLRAAIIPVLVVGLMSPALAGSGSGGGGGGNSGSGSGGGGGGGGGDRIRLECKAEGAVDISMDGKFESRRGRLKFDTSFEAAPGLGFDDGDLLDVTVAGTLVGQMELFQALNGDVEGDLNFDTTAQPDDDDLPFPPNFPAVGVGTSVVVGPLGCTLQPD